MAALTAALVLALAGTAGAPAFAVEPAAPSPAAEVYVLTAQSDSVVRTSHPLFDGSILVPRGSAHDRFAVQNASGGLAYLRVALTSVDVPDDAVRRSLSLTVSTPRGSGPAVPLDASGSCVTLLDPEPVAAGAAVDVDAALSLGDLTGTAGQAEPIGFSLLVVLDADPLGAGCDRGGSGDGEAGAAPPPAGGRPGLPPLAATGSDVMAAVVVASVLGAAGAATTLAARAHGARRRTRRSARDEG
jgi:hypothetical protein